MIPGESNGVPRKRWRWMAVSMTLGLAAVGLAVHLVAFLAVSIPLPMRAPEPDRQPFARYFEATGEDNRLLQEQALLFDSRPVFVPTIWNVASSLHGIARLRDEAELFARFEPVVRLQPEGWVPTQRPAAAPSSIEDLLQNEPLFPLRGFGQHIDPALQPALESRAISVALENLSGGRTPGPFSVQDLDATPPARLWSPAVFMVEIDPRSSGGSPLRVSGSGIAEWDAVLVRFLTSPAFRTLLEPGYYRVVIGP